MMFVSKCGNILSPRCAAVFDGTVNACNRLHGLHVFRTSQFRAANGFRCRRPRHRGFAGTSSDVDKKTVPARRSRRAASAPPPRSVRGADAAADARCAGPGRRPRAVPEREDQLAPGGGRVDHRRRDPGELLRQPGHAAAAVRGADRHQGALREGAAGADPAEGDCSTCRRRPATYATHAADPMYYPLYVGQQVGRAAGQVPERRRRSPTRPGSTTTTSSRPGATPTRSTASPTASRTTAR